MCALSQVRCVFSITHLSKESYLACCCFKPHIVVSEGGTYYVFFFKNDTNNQHTKGAERLKKNEKMYHCWLSIEKRLYLVCQAKRRHHLLYVGVVMSSCSPLVMLLMGINTIIWLLIQISLRIQSERTAWG